jgi:pimeloyl-ACP methyl ester carboxylesterase
MANLIANGIRIEYDTFGGRDDRPLLLVMGLGAQMIAWQDEFCEQLADAGHYVVRFDNRDVGLSEKLDDAGVPDMAAMVAAMLAGEPVEAPYTLDDMAADAADLLAALEIERANICGASLGGMIVQTMAINSPERVTSMTSIMSSTGNPEVPSGTPEAMAALMSPPGKDRDEHIERAVRVGRAVGSRVYPADESEMRDRAARAFDRSFYPLGVARQMAAAAAHGNRKAALAALRVPTLVIHGKDDPLVPVEGGLDTHEAIPEAELLVIDGMAHDLPRPLWGELVGGITRLTERAS